ncbi:Na+/H+-dicarboxylate symporter [Sphingomonas jatrophae]|uniref:Na+/H+-dicarboxylate symporter n=1 Tax=Sphingomonas jatrophae TaxID=1166337 RepID=A0A1I6JNU8_9SPHN|nr:Na+/H+-dicarboxylate symporter [Sphingomonas jatrophae]
MAVAKPVGKLWLDALTMTVVPLLFGLILTGIAGAAGQAAAGGIAFRTLILFAVGLVIACAASAGIATMLLGVWPVPKAAASLRPSGDVPALAPAGDWLTGLLPTNPIAAAAETAITPLVLFTLIFALAASRIAPDRREGLLAPMRGLVDAMLVIVGWVLWVAPLGVFALALQVGTSTAGGALGVLAHYVITVAACCLGVTLLALLAGALLGGRGPLAFLRAAAPAQAVAVSTQSSLATLPAMFQAVGALGVSEAASAVVLPLAVAVFRVASAAANVAVTVYLAHVHGVSLAAGTVAALVLVAATVSVAAVGLPAQVSFFATIAPVCVAAGVPVGLLPLLLAVESLPDLFRTLGNVTGDIAAAAIVGRNAPVSPAASPRP